MKSSATVFFPVIITGIILLVSAPAQIAADPCLVVYPNAASIYHYDVNEYYTVTYGDPLYDPFYDRGGEVLLEIDTDEIDLSIYQADYLAGFAPSFDGHEGYIIPDRGFVLVVDGFSNEPVVYDDVYLVFESVGDSGCIPSIKVNGEFVSGMTMNIGQLVVSTPTLDGNNYSDYLAVYIDWYGCVGLNIWAFADIDGDGIKTGGECFSAFSHDLTISAKSASWGAIKSTHR